MGRRALTGLLVVIGFGAPWLAAAQTGAGSWTAPRTAGGRPDLQGVWVARTATPLERPDAVAGRDRLTDEEVATLQARANRIFNDGGSAFAAGDAPFLAAWRDLDRFDSPSSTSSSIGMVEREFDNRTSMVIDPPDGRIPSVTPAGRGRQVAVADGWRDKTGPEDLSTIHRCITTGVPRLGGNFGAGPYSYYQIIQTPGHVVLLMEAYHDARIIPLDEDARPPRPSRCACGTAIRADAGMGKRWSSRPGIFLRRAISAARPGTCSWLNDLPAPVPTRSPIRCTSRTPPHGPPRGRLKCR